MLFVERDCLVDGLEVLTILDLTVTKRPEAGMRFRGVWVSDDLYGVCNTYLKKPILQAAAIRTE